MLRITVDSDSLRDLKNGVGDVTLSLPGVGVKALNVSAERARVSAIKQIPTELRLTEDYVASKMTLREATEYTPTAIVSATGEGTILTHFPHTQILVQNKRAKGDPFHKIPAGMQSGGINVVVKNGVKDITRGFLVPLKKGTEKEGNGYGVFTRIRGTKGKTKIRHRKGPSVDQAFAVVLKTLAPEIGEDLERQAIRELDAAIERIFE